MSWRFEHVTLGQRVRFGTGEAADNLAAEVARLGSKRVLLIAGKSEEAIAAAVTSKIDVAARCTDVAPHVPVDRAERARAL
ncbi:maleylacetate reductase, partial [Lentzea sp. PSKA42]|nr:maleylacetate reductase [Lentzea indica]